MSEPPIDYAGNRLRGRIQELEEDLAFTRADVAEARLHIIEKDAEIERLRAALERAEGDVNWMLNNRQFLNPECFDYLAAALTTGEKNGG